MKDPLSALNQLDAYAQHFTDVSLWTPFLNDVCQRHGLQPCQPIRVGVPGTYPAFIVAERWLIKFFGRLFNGGHSFQVERAANQLAALDPAIPIAQVIASGALGGDDWPWPYLIYAYIPSVSIGEVLDQISLPEQLQIAYKVGEMTRRLHNLPFSGSPVFPADHHPYLNFLENQRAVCVENQRSWGALPAHLIDQIDTFLPALETLAEFEHPPHLIHADLTRDHLLGRFTNGHWTTLALIDFGDMRTGSLYYELAALYLDLLGGYSRLLSAVLEGYGLKAQARVDLPRNALATCLLHQFNVFSQLSDAQRQAPTLEALAEMLYGPALNV